MIVGAWGEVSMAELLSAKRFPGRLRFSGLVCSHFLRSSANSEHISSTFLSKRSQFWHDGCLIGMRLFILEVGEVQAVGEAMLAQLTCLVVLPPLDERLRGLYRDRDREREFFRDEEEEPRRTGEFSGLRRRRPRGGAGWCWSAVAWDAVRCRTSSLCRLTYGSQNRCGQPLDAVRCSPLHREQHGLHTWPSAGSLVPQEGHARMHRPWIDGPVRGRWCRQEPSSYTSSNGVQLPGGTRRTAPFCPGLLRLL